jgi:hypothetical protein
MPTMPMTEASRRWPQLPLRAGAALALLALLAAAWAVQAGLRFTPTGLTLFAIPLAAAALLCDRPGRGKPWAAGAYYFALWLLMLQVLNVLSFLAATLGGPFYDDQLARIDGALGFSWRAWHDFVAAKPTLNAVFAVAYYSGLVQVLASLIYFAASGHSAGNQELWWTALIALLLTVAISALLPAIGAFAHYQADLGRADHLTTLLALRDGSVTHFSETKGIVTLPSYHTTQAILLMYVHRRQPRVLPSVVVLNLLMLLSTPTFGGHYLVDMIAGAGVAAAAILAVRVSMKRQAKHTAYTGGIVVDTVCQPSPPSIDSHTPPLVEPISKVRPSPATARPWRYTKS